jgi:hypothetical protein
MRLVTRLLREPLLHFAVIGGLCFLLFVAVSGPQPTPLDTIVIEPERVLQLAEGFEAAWLRPPTDDELRAIVDDFIREEIYYREALALGLDRDDTVIRQRLRQKMEFLTDTGADLLSPDPAELAAFFAANERHYAQGPRLALEQVYLGEAPEPGKIEAALGALRSVAVADPAADPVAVPAGLGEPTRLPAMLDLALPDAVDSVFGPGFFEQLADLPAGEWAGPVESAYGIHLVRITQGLPARTPSLDEVRDAVLRDWNAEKGLELREQLFARLRDRYTIEIRGGLAGVAAQP